MDQKPNTELSAFNMAENITFQNMTEEQRKPFNRTEMLYAEKEAKFKERMRLEADDANLESLRLRFEHEKSKLEDTGFWTLCHQTRTSKSVEISETDAALSKLLGLLLGATLTVLTCGAKEQAQAVVAFLLNSLNTLMGKKDDAATVAVTGEARKDSLWTTGATLTTAGSFKTDRYLSVRGGLHTCEVYYFAANIKMTKTSNLFFRHRRYSCTVECQSIMYH